MPLSATLPRKNCSFTQESSFLGIHLNPPPRRIQGDGHGVAVLIDVNGVNITLTLAQHISDGLTFMALSQSRAG
jgi:hypothetical protein